MDTASDLKQAKEIELAHESGFTHRGFLLTDAKQSLNTSA